MGQTCSATSITLPGGGDKPRQDEALPSALEQVLISTEECGEFLATKTRLPDGIASENLALLEMNLFRLKAAKVLCIGDIDGLQGLMNALLKIRISGKMQMLQDVYLIGRKVDNRVVECAWNLCSWRGSRSIDTLVIAHPKRNRVGDPAVLAIASQLAASNLKTLVVFGSKLGDQGATALAKQINPKTTLRRLVLYGKNIGNETIAAFAVALKGIPLEELVLGGPDFSDGVELRDLFSTIWAMKKCTRLGILSFNLGDSVADIVVDLIRSTGYSPHDFLLLAGMATAQTFSVLSTWWGDAITRLSICSFLADDSALESFLIKADSTRYANCALELVCGRAFPEQLNRTQAQFEQMGYLVVPWEIPSRTDAVDLVAAAPGVVLSNSPGSFLESHIFARILLRGRRDQLMQNEILSFTTGVSARSSTV